MELLNENSVIRIVAEKFRFELYPGNASARFFLAGTKQIYFFHPGGDCDLMEAQDECTAYSDWEILSEGEKIVIRRFETSKVWVRKEVRFVFTQDAIELYFILEGRGQVDEVRYCRGCYRGMEYGFAGEFDELYTVAPSFSERLFYHPTDSFSISCGNDLSDMVGGHALASCPHCFGLHDRRDEKYLVAGIVARPGEYTYDAYRWNPMVKIPPTPYHGDCRLAGGFAIEYAGKKEVAGVWETPRLVFTFAPSCDKVLPAYLNCSYKNGYLPKPKRRKTFQWWNSPIYCTWHDQGAMAHLGNDVNYCKWTGKQANDFLNEALLEEWLGALIDHDCKPGIIILDDRWQKNLNDGAPDTKRFSDMRKWIESCHKRGMRVFLWTAAWNNDNLPPEQCMTRDGKPICCDITNPAYEARFREMLRVYFSDAPDCLNADGVKMDGLLGLPTGKGLNNYGNLWGLELQKLYLKILFEETKKHKLEACISTFTAHPYLAEYCDMVRIADMYTNRLTPHQTMLHRAEVYRQTCPYAQIDTDGQFEMYMLDDYASELAEQAKIGIPTLYNAKYLRRQRFFLPASYNELTEDDYEKIAKVLKQFYKKHPQK